MYGQNHRYCQGCGHVVRYGHPQCAGCGTGFAELMLLDDALSGAMVTQEVGFDPLDGQFAFDIPGTDLAIEPDGQLDVNMGGIDIPVQDDPLAW
jgi:hypothetical protein